MARRKRKDPRKFDQAKAAAAARRKAFFAAGGTAKQWSLLAGKGVHGYDKSKAARSKRACRGRVVRPLAA